MLRIRLTVNVAVGVAVLIACGRTGTAQNVIRPAEMQVAAAELSITDAALKARIRILADDMLEGRGPGSRGDELAQRYIAAQFQSLGFKAAAPGRSWFQPVPLVGVTH